MKTSFLSILLFCVSAGSAFSQATDKLPVSDSARIELERKQLLKELTDLRDSINQSLNVFSRSIRKVSPKKDKQMKNASQNLGQYRDRLKTDIQKVQLTTQNAWSPNNLKTIRADMTEIRKEHKKMLIMYENP